MKQLEELEELLAWKVFQRERWVSVSMSLNKIDSDLMKLRYEKEDLEAFRIEQREKLIASFK